MPRTIEHHEDDEMRNSRATETREYADLSDEDRVSMLRHEAINAALPTVPDIKGFRTIWLSKDNQYDTLARRARLGYVPVKPEEVPQADFTSCIMKDGAYGGCIAVNEMILHKIPEQLYQKYMHLVHHQMPNEEEEKLSASLAAMKDGSLSKGHSLVREVGDGTDELIKRPSSPRGRFQ